MLGPELSYFGPGQDPELVQLAKAEVDKWIAENGVKEYEYHDGDKRDDQVVIKNVSRSQTGVKTAPKLPSSIRLESFFFLKSIRVRRRLSGLNHFTPWLLQMEDDGTDDSVNVEICSDEDTMDCCTTGRLSSMMTNDW